MSTVNGNGDRSAEWQRLNVKIEHRNLAWLESERNRREKQSRMPCPMYRLVNEIMAAVRTGYLQPRQVKRRGRPRLIDLAGV